MQTDINLENFDLYHSVSTDIIDEMICNNLISKNDEPIKNSQITKNNRNKSNTLY
jgi:hypothetical protein